MSFIKHRSKPDELKVLESLNERMNLSVKEKNDLSNLAKGFEGEQKFDEWLITLSNDWNILNDLRFEWNNTYYQIDSLSLLSETIHLFEVKNYEGDYYIENDTWYSVKGLEINNPFLQLTRAESLLRRFIKNLGFNYSIESYLIFINPEFHLYHAPRNQQIIFPTQLPRFMNNLSKKTSKIAKNHTQLIEQLLSAHLTKSPYKRIPKYTFDSLKKGVVCMKCRSFINSFRKISLVCSQCGYKESVTSAVLRSIDEYMILFPEKKITRSTIQEWCKIIPKKTLQKILSNNYEQIIDGKNTHYIVCNKSFN
ncbi:hypothetical protein B5V89_13775 [Heyndrickxia sporothermodurans]|uniref:nuclease-related domain-containing protein n=1 Tax=Heyndrickxia sporothermodurans TaxID=46224 RepID=UPI000D3594D5|nr:nuclease-related domain-containing protein [Heyndrickxia sporothermodurans]PTY77694.1 hypothetical protein B5V89_13775 [Heyndrickxia sporothermodurans]